MITTAWLGQLFDFEWLNITQRFLRLEYNFQSQFINIKILEKGKYVDEGIVITG